MTVGTTTNQSTLLARNTNAISAMLLAGTYAVLGMFIIILAVGCAGDMAHFTKLAIGCVITLTYIITTSILTRRKAIRALAYLLTIFYMLFATVIILKWSIDTPIGLLIFGVVIIVAGIVLGARNAIYTAIISSLLIFSVQALNELGWYQSDIAWLSGRPSFGDAIAYSVVFYFMALVSWLYNREIERAFRHASIAEHALLRQQTLLKKRVEQRTKELRRTQLQEMQQLYRFAEIGQSGATLLHELANQLTALTLEVEEMHKTQRTHAMAKVSEITKNLDDLICATRNRINGHKVHSTVNIAEVIDDALAYLQGKADQAQVVIDWQPPTTAFECSGDPTSLRQVVAILISNAIDSYEGTHIKEKIVRVHTDGADNKIIIRIQDAGKGIVPEIRKNLFKPFNTSKKTGLGIGLFIARQTIRSEFLGNLFLSKRTDLTEFVMHIPRRKEKN